MAYNIITSQDLNSQVLEIDNTKLTVKLSSDNNNILAIDTQNGGLLVDITGVTSALGTMAGESKNDYLAKSEIQTTGLSGFNNDQGFITQEQLPQDKFLNNASYNDQTQILTLTLSDSTTVTVNLQDLIPVTVKSQGGLSGSGTAASPLELDKTDARQVLAYGTMADEAQSDYYTKSTQDSTFQSQAGMSDYYTKTAQDSKFQTQAELAEYVEKTSLDVELKDLSGTTLGWIRSNKL